MIGTSALFSQKIAESSRQFRARLLHDGAAISGEIRNITINKGACGESFSIGSIYSSYIEVTLDECEEILENKELLLQIGLVIDDTVEHIDMGYYTVTKPSRSAYQTTFTAVGRITSKLNCLPTLPAEQTLANLAAAITEATGVQMICKGVVLAGTIEEDLTGLTCREVLEVITAVLGGFATEDNAGNIVISKFSTADQVAFNGERTITDPEFSDYDYELTGVKVTTTEEWTDEDGTVHPEVSFTEGTPRQTLSMKYMTESLFSAFKTNVVGYTYRPGTIPLALGDPRLDPWDCILYADAKGGSYVVPCLSIVHTFDGGLSTVITAPGESESESESQVKGPLVQKMERVAYQIFTAEQAILRRITADEADLKYATIKTLVATEAKITNLSGEFVSFKEGEFETLKSDQAEFEEATVNKLTAVEASITAVSGEFANFKTGEFETLKAAQAEFRNTITQNIEAVTGKIDNLTAVAITTETLEAKVGEFGYLKAAELEAEVAEFGYLKANTADLKYATITSLNAKEAEIKKIFSDYVKTDTLIADYIKATDIDAKYATIKSLEATEASVKEISGNFATFKEGDFKNLQADVAEIDAAYMDEAEVNSLVVKKGYLTEAQVNTLVAGKGYITELETNHLLTDYAKVTELNAVDSKITNLNAKAITTDNLSSKIADFGFITAAEVSADYATIKSLDAAEAQIESLSGEVGTFKTLITGQITAIQGDIQSLNTNTVKASELESKVAEFGYAKAEDLEAESADIRKLFANYATVTQLNATNGNITTLSSTVAEINSAYMDKAEVESLVAGKGYLTEAQVNTLVVGKGYFTEAQVNNLVVGKGYITTAETNTLLSNYVQTSTLTAEYIKASEIASTYATISNLSAANAKIDGLDTKYAKIDLANVKDGSITRAMIGTGVVGTAQIAEGSITDAHIVGLTASKITAGKLDAGVIEVVNLNAANITVGTINGQQIASGAIDTSKLTNSLSSTITSASTNAAQALKDAAAAQDDIDNLEIGGRNLILGTTTADITGWKHTGWSGAITTYDADARTYQITSTNGWSSYGYPTTDYVGEQLTFSGYFKLDGENSTNTANIGVYFKTLDALAYDMSIKMGELSADDDWQYFSYTFDGMLSFMQIFIRGIGGDATTGSAKVWMKDIKLEKGNRATDWTPAPEDIEDKISDVETAVNLAQTTANGKNTVFYQASAPSTSGRKTNDVWFDTDDSNKMYYWNGSSWAVRQFGTNAIAAASITNALIADATIQSAKIANLDAAKITTGTLSADRIAASSIVAAKIASGAITSDKIAANAVTAGKIASNAVTAGTIAADSITTEKIASGAVVADSIAANAITADKIVASAVTTDKIAANAIIANKIASGTITTTQLDAAEIFANTANVGKIVATQTFSNAISTHSVVVSANTTANAAKEAAAAAQESIDNMSVGGRNLLKPTTNKGGNCTAGTNYNVTINTKNSDTYFYINLYEGLVLGEEYTLSFMISGLADGEYYNFLIQNKTTYGAAHVTNATRAHVTFTVDSVLEGLTQILIDDSTRYLTSERSITLTELKLEKGNTATDWTPAPEDTTSRITSAQTTANTANSTANSALTKANTANSVITSWCYNNNTTYIDGGTIYTGTIKAAQIDAGAITTEKLAAGAVTAGKISVDTLSALSANLGTIKAGVLQSENFAMSDFAITEDADGNEVITGTVTSGLKIDLNNKAYYTPHITMKDNYIELNGYMTIGDRRNEYWATRGNYSFAQGLGNVAAGDYSSAMGKFNDAIGNQSHAEGGDTIASGASSHSEGTATKAEDIASHAEGHTTTSSNIGSHSEGTNTTASGYGSHAEGALTVASAGGSHAEGTQTTASGHTSHAEGLSTDATGYASHAEGYYAEASGADGSHAEGNSTIASGQSSHAEGAYSVASGAGSHAEGGDPASLVEYTLNYQKYPIIGGSDIEILRTTSSGTASHAEGLSGFSFGKASHAENYATVALGEASHAEGYYTIAYSNYQHVQGKYNIADTNGTYAHIVGNGTSDTARSNAYTLDWSGNAWFAGTISEGGTLLSDKYAPKSHTHSYLPLSGGTLNNNATITLNMYGTRKLVISGNSISADMSSETGGWAGNFASVKDPSGTTTTMLGWYGSASGLNHIFMGGTYSDPALKMTGAGQFTFKSTPYVGSTLVSLANHTHSEYATGQGKGVKVITLSADSGTLSSADLTDLVANPERVVFARGGYYYFPENLSSSTTWYYSCNVYYSGSQIIKKVLTITKSSGTYSKSEMTYSPPTYTLDYRLQAAQSTATGSDANSATTTGFHYINGTTNRPPFNQNNGVTGNDYRILTTAYSTAWLQQIATDFRCDDIYYRRNQSGTWQSWRRLAFTDECAPVSHTHSYLPLSGGKLTGILNLTENIAQINFRPGHASYDGVISYQTTGNEAMVFSTKNAVTSFMFVNGEDTITNISGSRWQSLTPGLQIKNNRVAIGKLIANGVTPSYTLDVGGTIYASSTIYEGGTALSSKYAPLSHTHSYLPLSGGTMTGGITLPNSTPLYAKNSSGTAHPLIYLAEADNLTIGNPASGNPVPGGLRVYTPNGSMTFTSNGGTIQWYAYDNSTTGTSAIFNTSKDNIAMLGSSSYRWYRLYQTASSISTSDEREKSNIRKISEYPLISTKHGRGNILEQIFNDLVPKTYTLDAEKKNDVHIGFVAQDIEKTINKYGLTVDDLGIIDHEYWIDEETGEERDRYGLAYEEFTALNTYILQKQQNRLVALERYRDQISGEVSSIRSELISTQNKLNAAMMKIAEQEKQIEQLMLVS